ncbi:MAG: HAD family hydrolase [Phycisphaerae bacterium]
MALQAVLFDLDSTLICYAPGGRSFEVFWLQYLAEAGIVVPDPAALTQALIKARKKIWNDEDAQRVHRVKMVATMAGVLQDAAASVGLTVPPTIATASAQALVDYLVSRCVCLPDTVTVLNTLRQRGLKLGLITNGDGYMQAQKLKHTGLEGWFDYLGIEGALGYGKPDPRAFHNALAQLKLTPAEVVMVGDNLGHDVQTAQALGIRSFWLSSKPRPEIPAEVILNRLGELPERLFT